MLTPVHQAAADEHREGNAGVGRGRGSDVIEATLVVDHDSAPRGYADAEIGLLVEAEPDLGVEAGNGCGGRVTRVLDAVRNEERGRRARAVADGDGASRAADRIGYAPDAQARRGDDDQETVMTHAALR
jgi:hypothetical protein